MLSPWKNVLVVSKNPLRSNLHGFLPVMNGVNSNCKIRRNFSYIKKVLAKVSILLYYINIEEKNLDYNHIIETLCYE